MEQLRDLSTGAKIVLGGAVVFLIVSFFNWQEVDLGPIGEAGVSMWDGIGWLAGLLAIALIAWQVLRLANVNLEVGLSPTMVTAALAALLLVFTFIKFLVDDEFRTFWAWLGLALAIVVAVGAWLAMQAAGESLDDVRERFASRETGAGGSAAAPPPPPAAGEPDVAPEPPAEPSEGGQRPAS
jgi:hypothetical protein